MGWGYEQYPQPSREIIPEDMEEASIRELIGEVVPPLLTKKIAEQIFA